MNIAKELATASESIICDVLTVEHSSGFPDHFTRIRKGDRSLTMFMSKIKGRCEYHAAELDWLLNGAAKPYILAFDDSEPEGLAEYEAALRSPSALSAIEDREELVKALREARTCFQLLINDGVHAKALSFGIMASIEGALSRIGERQS